MRLSWTNNDGILMAGAKRFNCFVNAPTLSHSLSDARTERNDAELHTAKIVMILRRLSPLQEKPRVPLTSVRWTFRILALLQTREARYSFMFAVKMRPSDRKMAASTRPVTAVIPSRDVGYITFSVVDYSPHNAHSRLETIDVGSPGSEPPCQNGFQRNVRCPFLQKSRNRIHPVLQTLPQVKDPIDGRQ